MISTEFREALNDLTALAGDVPPGTWQRLRRVKARFEALLEPIQGLETAPLCVRPGVDRIFNQQEARRDPRDLHK